MSEATDHTTDESRGPKYIGLTCPKCFTRHGIPIPPDVEMYSGVEIGCGCGNNIVFVIGELELIEE